MNISKCVTWNHTWKLKTQQKNGKLLIPLNPMVISHKSKDHTASHYFKKAPVHFCVTTITEVDKAWLSATPLFT